jgi:hypothetical protein
MKATGSEKSSKHGIAPHSIQDFFTPEALPFAHVDVQQRTTEWQELRRGKITGSEFSKVQAHGKGRRDLILRVALQRLGYGTREAFGGTEHTWRGIELEPEARRVYEEMSGQKVLEIGFHDLPCEEDSFLAGFVGCSPDGVCQDGGFIEIKCPSDENFDGQAQKVPSKYLHQIKFNAFVMDRSWCDLVIYNRNRGIRVHRIEFSEEDREAVRQELLAAIEEVKETIDRRSNDLTF